VHAMVSCICGGETAETGSTHHRHAAVMWRLEELLEANSDRTLYLAELCSAAAVSERTLRACCQEHLGMSPTRYLWLRRMHLARRRLRIADPTATTVTEVATKYGFWELGRFSVAYGSLFGESPSASLRRPPEDPDRKKIRLRPGSCRNLHSQPRSEGPTLEVWRDSGRHRGPSDRGLIRLVQRGGCPQAPQVPLSIPRV
jgi:AraC-like DNA-binding protein